MEYNNKITFTLTAIVIAFFVGAIPIYNAVQEDVSERTYPQSSNDNNYAPYIYKSEEDEDKGYYY